MHWVVTCLQHTMVQSLEKRILPMYTLQKQMFWQTSA